jgi:hypothetical protein
METRHPAVAGHKKPKKRKKKKGAFFKKSFDPSKRRGYST